jgi:hypothetical protein
MASRENSVSAEAYDRMTKEGQRIAIKEMDSLAGQVQAFTTGATRSADDHKIDFEGHLHPDVLHYFGEYMHRHRIQRDGKMRASDNWQEGIPLHKYMKSLQRHNLDLARAWRGTVTTNPDNGQVQSLGDLLCAMLFNVQGMLFELMNRDMQEDASIEKDERKWIEAGEPVDAKFSTADNIVWGDRTEPAVQEIQEEVTTAILQGRDQFILTICPADGQACSCEYSGYALCESQS